MEVKWYLVYFKVMIFVMILGEKCGGRRKSGYSVICRGYFVVAEWELSVLFLFESSY